MIENNLYNFIKEAKGEGVEMPRTAAGVVVISLDSGRVLLQKRAGHLSHPDTLGCIGGHLNSDETPEEALRREFKEETGYDLDIDVSLIMKQEEDELTYYNYVAYVTNEFHDFQPLPGFEDETKWFDWFEYDELMSRDDIHPGLEKLFEIEGVVESIFDGDFL